MISSSCMERPGVRDLIADMNVSVVQEEATLRGIDNKKTVYQLKII